jgi:hypothetical protein
VNGHGPFCAAMKTGMRGGAGNPPASPEADVGVRGFLSSKRASERQALPRPRAPTDGSESAERWCSRFAISPEARRNVFNRNSSHSWIMEDTKHSISRWMPSR